MRAVAKMRPRFTGRMRFTKLYISRSTQSEARELLDHLEGPRCFRGWILHLDLDVVLRREDIA